MFALLALLLVSSPPDPEVARIQSHLRRVESELRASGDGGLGPAERRWRVRLVDELHRYWTRGRFPRNTYVDRRSPVFVDRDGTRCAVAQLIHASGRGDLVERVAATHNTAYVAELAGDAELVRWLDEHGLTAAEAARIQPAYEPGPGMTGASCVYAGDCASLTCIYESRRSYCSEWCEDDDSCPAAPDGTPMMCGDFDAERMCLYRPEADDDGRCAVGAAGADLGLLAAAFVLLLARATRGRRRT